MKITTRKLAVSAILLAADVMLTRVFAFNTPLMKIGLGFAAIALCAMLYGPAWAALVSALGDLIGSLAFPTGAYFPGFTLTAAVTGLIFGLCLYKRERSWIHAVLAAALNCLIVSFLANSAMISFITGNSYAAMLATRAVQLAVMLPDSSEVWLNAASQIRYHKSFLNNREIFLEKGEAFFKVKKAQGAPFRVYFRESRIEVTGTEFNIKAGHMESEITLFTGSIKFQAEEGQRELPMQPNERIVYNTQAKSVVRTNIDINEYDWRSSKYRFTNKPLQEFIDFINRSYHVNIIIKEEKLKELKFNGTIRKDEPLTNIIEKICISLDLKEKQENNNIILY